MNQDKIAIVGGGIGGLTLAIALQQKGFPVTVYEAAPKIQPLGAGLTLAANAVKAFINIGISDAVLQVGKILKALRVKDVHGNILTETDSEKINARFGIINSFTIHRADLHEVLIRQLHPGTLLLNKQLKEIEQGSPITLTFSDGSSATADYVIACDGIHSVVRKKLLPEVKPRFAGYTCWRAVTDTIPANIDMNETSETWGPGSRFGIVPLSNNRIYWFACLNAKANDAQMRAFGIPDLLKHFGNFHAPIPQILNNTAPEKIIWNDIIDIRPLKKFAFGNILLMGDAAHATTPNMGQGACMAIEDAAVLANCIATDQSLTEAFQKFELKRIARTTTIVKNSWNIGKMAQWENSVLVSVRNAVVKRTPPSVMEKQIKFLTNIDFT